MRSLPFGCHSGALTSHPNPVSLRTTNPRPTDLWFPKLTADAKLQVIIGPAPAGPCMGIWRGTVLDWPGSVFMVGAPP
jgi:hypothetical protein